MRATTPASLPAAAVLALLVAGLAGCDRTTADPNDREVPWAYGPLVDTASAEHLGGAGKKGAPISKGWQCRLQQQSKLVIRPFQLSSEHPLFGKVALAVRLYANDTLLDEQRTGVLQSGNATFTLDVDPAVGPKVNNLIFFYVKA
ncbi:MAG: hypothetical protein FJ301_12345 [Planctomycetes bacterium]|nr:hypothetical protein [Planctomycetota bacterium]